MSLFGREVRAELEAFKERNRSLVDENSILKGKNNALTAENRLGSEKFLKLTKELREQTEADLLVNALKAVGIIKEPEHKSFEFYQQQAAAHQARMRQGMGNPYNSSGLSGLLGGYH